MTDYSDLFSKHEPDELLRELNGNVLWYWKPMDPHDPRQGKASSAPFDAARRIETLEAARDGAYTERNRLVALLSTMFPSGTKKTEIPGWDEAWHGCVYIDLPVGQASWHYHDSEAYLFAHLPPYEGEWDGHTTEEKYERISLAANHIKQTDELLADYMKFSNALMIQTDNQHKRIQALEAALSHIYAWYPISVTQPRQTIDDMREFARAALAGEKKDV